MLNRSAAVVGVEPAFLEWLGTIGISAEMIRERVGVTDRRVFLIPACADLDEGEEVVSDLFEEIFLRELRAWQLFIRWFTIDVVPFVEDIGRGEITEEV